MEKIGRKAPVRWYLREWRDKFNLSQEQVALRLDTNKGQISKLERGAQRLNDSWIAGYASALNIAPGDLLRDPNAPTLDDLLRQASPADRETAVRLVEALLKKAG